MLNKKTGTELFDKVLEDKIYEPKRKVIIEYYEPKKVETQIEDIKDENKCYFLKNRGRSFKKELIRTVKILPEEPESKGAHIVRMSKDEFQDWIKSNIHVAHCEFKLTYTENTLRDIILVSYYFEPDEMQSINEFFDGLSYTMEMIPTTKYDGYFKQKITYNARPWNTILWKE